jgi:hypothetical protein
MLATPFALVGMNESKSAPIELTVPSSAVPKIWSLPGPGPLLRQVVHGVTPSGPIVPEVFGFTPVVTHEVASAICAVVGSVICEGNESLRWKPWYDRKMKALSFFIGPPPDAPNWFSRNGVTVLANPFLASKASVWRSQNALP